MIPPPFSSEILSRAVEEIIVKEHLEEALKSGRKLRVKFGIDPTATDLHLGHTVPLRKLRQFQNLGHKAVLIIGDFTAMVGDPSGRSEARRPLSEKEVRQNMKHYLRQVGKILDIKKAEVHYNSEWYKSRTFPTGKVLDEKVGAAFLYDLMSKITVQRALERDDFQKRLKRGDDISLLEVLYPLLQGYDSVAVRSDLEIGGSDQKFNLLMGRKIQRRFSQNEQDVLTTWLVEGTDGARKMSKSLGNYIGLEEKPDSMFGKIMSIPDDLMDKYLIALTDISMRRIEKMQRELRSGLLNPRDAKLFLAETLVGMYHGARRAKAERERFIKVFSRKELPEEMPVIKLNYGQWDPAEFLVAAQLASSKSEARRLIAGGAMSVDGVVAVHARKIKISKGTVIRVGKRRFLRVIK